MEIKKMYAAERVINWKKNLFFIWFCQILSIAGFSSAMPFIPVYIRDRWGITGEHELGIWMSAFYFFGMLSFCVSTPIWGMLSDRFGRKLMLLRACYVDAILFPCFILAPNPIWLITLRFITSAFTGTVSAAQTLVVTTTPPEHHGFALGTISSAVWSGSLIGYATGGMIVHYFGFTAAFLCCGGMYLLAGILAHLFVEDNFQPPESEAIQERSHSFSGISAAIWMVFLLIILTAIARRFDDPYVALMVEKIHGASDTAFHTGWISAMAAVGGIISGMLIGRLCDLLSPEKVALPSLLLAGVSMVLQAFSGTLLVFGVIRFGNFLCSAGLESVFFSILSRISPEERRGTLFGLASGLRMGGILLSTVLSGAIIFYSGVKLVFITAGFLFLLVIPFFYLALKLSHGDLSVSVPKMIKNRHSEINEHSQA